MKICIFTENYYKGGLDTFLINLINAWPNQDDEITLVCNHSHPGIDTLQEKILSQLKIYKYDFLFQKKNINKKKGIESWRGSLFARMFIVILYRLMQYPILLPWYIFALTKYFKKTDFDRLLVVNGGYPASLICRCSSIAWWIAGKRPKSVMNFHNASIEQPWYLILDNLIDRLIIKSTSHIVSVSNNCVNTIRKRKSFIGCNKLSYIYNGIADPIEKLKKLPVIKKLKNTRYCLMLATYESRKGHAYLLKAFQSVIAEYPDVMLQIFGHGKEHEKQFIKNEVKKLGLEKNVKLNDFTTQTENLLINASVLVVPSQSHESFGLTIIEAMAYGVPVVTTDVGGMPEVIGNSNAGYVCSKNNPEEFAININKILGNPELALQLGHNGRSEFERKFTATVMANKYKVLLD